MGDYELKQTILLVGGIIFLALIVNTWVIVGAIRDGFRGLLDQLQRKPPRQ